MKDFIQYIQEKSNSMKWKKLLKPWYIRNSFANVKVIKTYTIYELMYDCIEKGKILNKKLEFEDVEGLMTHLNK